MHGDVLTGPEVLRQYLAANGVRLAALDAEGFRAWLLDRIAEQQHRDVFRQKCLVRDIVRSHAGPLRQLSGALRDAKDADDASADHERLEELARRIGKLRKGIAGLTRAVAEGRADSHKLAAFQQELEQRVQEFSQRGDASPERQRLNVAESALARLREEIGLAREEDRLAELQRTRGRRMGAAGARFEAVARRAIESVIVPSLQPAERPWACLYGATLGVARAEFDALIVARRPGQSVVDVAAIVEVKRNPNDLVRGFRLREENLAWLTGDRSAYDPQLYRTAVFPSGHFERPISHTVEGERFEFDPSSFARFRRDSRAANSPSGLYFLTRRAPLVGCTSPELARILHMVATDPDSDPAGEAWLASFRRRVLELVGPSQTIDVLQRYLEGGLADRIVFCERDDRPDADRSTPTA